MKLLRSPMVDEFLAFIKEKNLFAPEDKILLAVSGGVDSMVLAHLLKTIDASFAFAHCNFQLRKDESDKDEVFVKARAKDISVKCFSKRFDTKKYARDYGLSTQVAARDLRYNWFEELTSNYGFKYIATAHHLNDSIETILYNFTKGTGIKGLAGISSKSGNIIRPLLFAKRSDIEEYAKRENLKWREDSSNASDAYSRNKLRHHVLPVLKDINSSLEDTFRNTALRIESTNRLVEESLRAFTNRNVKRLKSDIFINKEAVKTVELVLLDELLKPFGFNFTQVLDIHKKLNSEGQLFYSKKYVLNIDREDLIISEITESQPKDKIYIKHEDNEVEFSQGLLKLNLKKASEIDILADNKVAQLDFDLLNYPLVVRKWESGDFFQPLGMSGKKKLSDFMIDSKIPLNLKNRVSVIEAGGEVVWVIGHRIDDRYKITSTTKTCLEIRLSEK